MKVQVLCKLNKMDENGLLDMEHAGICDIGWGIASTVTARYYKGIGAHKDNMVMEYEYSCEIRQEAGKRKQV